MCATVKRHRATEERRLGWLLLLPIGVLVILGVWFTLPSSRPALTMPEADVHLLITMSGWSPSHFEARAGVPTTIMLMTDPSERTMSDSTHSFILNATNTREYVLAGSTEVFTVVFPHPGTYTFWCLTCCGVTRPSEGAAYMSGEVTVTG